MTDSTKIILCLLAAAFGAVAYLYIDRLMKEGGLEPAAEVQIQSRSNSLRDSDVVRLTEESNAGNMTWQPTDLPAIDGNEGSPTHELAQGGPRVLTFGRAWVHREHYTEFRMETPLQLDTTVAVEEDTAPEDDWVCSKPRDWRANARNFDDRDFSGSSMTYADFRCEQLSGSNFTEAHLVHADFRKAVLIGANFRRADLLEGDFSGGTLRNADFGDSVGIGTTFRGADLRDAKFGCDECAEKRKACQEPSSTCTNGSGYAFWFADFREADLRGVDLGPMDLLRPTFTDTDLRGSNLEATYHFDPHDPAAWRGAIYDDETKLPPGLDPDVVGMVYGVAEPSELTSEGQTMDEGQPSLGVVGADREVVADTAPSTEQASGQSGRYRLIGAPSGP